MKVSVITVVLNDLDGLRRTAQSVVAQDTVESDWVIADGGSTDGSVEYALHLARHHSNIRFLPGPDRGIYDGMNRALSTVPDNHLVWFLNSGDFFLSRKSLRVAYDATPPDGWSGGPMVLVHANGKVHRVSEVPSLLSSARNPGIQIPAQPTVLAAKSLYVRLGTFREDLRFASDGVLLQEFARNERPTIIETPLVAFVLGGRSSVNFRETLNEYWLAGYRPKNWKDRFKDREIGQLKTWIRSSQVGSVNQYVRWTRNYSTRLVAPDFPHWAHHRQIPRDLSCCINMGNLVKGS